MGAVLSFLRDAYHSLSLLIGGIAEESANFKTLEARISSPQLPVQNPTASFWQQKPPYPKLVNIKSAELPALADIVIIGSGISGASIAYTILNECRSMGIARNVTILEGRTICSGATGRNGGHIKVAPYLEYAAFKKRFGPKSAKKIMEFQMMHRPTLLELTKAEELEVAETREVMTVDAFVDSSMWQKAQGTLAMLKADLPNVASGVEILSAEKLQEVNSTRQKETTTSN
jgi:monoamine oxidase